MHKLHFGYGKSIPQLLCAWSWNEAVIQQSHSAGGFYSGHLLNKPYIKTQDTIDQIQFL